MHAEGLLHFIREHSGAIKHWLDPAAPAASELPPYFKGLHDVVAMPGAHAEYTAVAKDWPTFTSFKASLELHSATSYCVDHHHHRSSGPVEVHYNCLFGGHAVWDAGPRG